MSDDPILAAFRDIWDWQRKIEARLKGLEKRMVEAENDIDKRIDGELKLNDSFSKLQQFALQTSDSVISSWENIIKLEDQIKGKG